MGTKLAWSGLTILLAAPIFSVGTKLIMIIGAVVMVIGVILMWLDK